MKLYVARHGETDWNSEHRMQGWIDIPLNATGLGQAEALAGRLTEAGIKPERIYASPLTRARQTAAPVAERAGLTVTLLDGLKEIGFGEWEGLIYNDEIAARDPEIYAAWRADRYRNAAPGGENCRTVIDRLAPAMKRILDDGEGTVLIVMHGAVLKTLYFAVNGLDFKDFATVPVIGNGEYTEFDPEAVRRFADRYGTGDRVL